jgi:ribosome maturation factor RimP
MFNVFYQIENDNPIASSMTLELSSSGLDQILEVTIKAVELSGSSWVPLEGDKMVDIFSTVV